MPTTTVTNRYYPTLSEVVSVDELPEFLSFAQNGLEALLNKIHYKNLQYSKSYRGDAAFYSLDIVGKNIGLDLPFGLRFVLNPDINGDTSISSFPVTVEYQWEILAFLRSFNLRSFAFTPQAFYELGLQVFKLTEEQVLAHTLNYFVEPAAPSTSKYEQLIDDLNQQYPTADLVLPAGQEPTVSSVVSLIHQNPVLPEGISALLFSTYILDNDLAVTKQRLQQFYNIVVPQGIEAYIKQLLTPKAKASLTLSAAIEFPRNVLVPLNADLEPDESVNAAGELVRSRFTFAEATIYADTEEGIGFGVALAGGLTPLHSQIGNTGIILSFFNAKLDLSSTSNIPEADAAGYPTDFAGLYVQEASLGFAKFGQPNLKVFGRDVLIGTGGISGTFGFEEPGQMLSFQYGDFSVDLDAFSLTFRQNAITQSAISGTLTIPGFKNQDGSLSKVGVDAAFSTTGDFIITARPLASPYTINIPEVLTIEIRSLSIGKRGTRHFAAVAGKLDFIANVPALGPLLPKGIEVHKLLIWQDGSIEFEGGALTLSQSVGLQVGPVKMEVRNLSIGAYTSNAGRDYYFFGFDGMINTGRAGVSATGNGLKYYFTHDSGTFDHFIRVDGIGIDVTIPGNVSKEKAAFLLNGYLSVSNPTGPTSTAATEYKGSVSFSLPKLRIAGSAGMSVTPSIPAFVVDIGVELATPIPLGGTGLGIYGFRGLIGQHYVPAMGGYSSYWSYYKAKSKITGREGIEIDKFERLPGYSLGAGASIATTFDAGRSFSSKLFMLLNLPDVFLIQGQAAILAQRIGLDTSADPPFSALIEFSNQSVRGNLGVNYNLPDQTLAGFFQRGDILSLQGNMELAFFFNNSSGWYLNIGKDSPERDRVRARVLRIFQGQAYLMLSSRGIRAGAGIKFDFRKNAGGFGVGVNAYLNLGGSVSFNPVQIGGYLQVGGSAYLRAFGKDLKFSANAMLAVEAPLPFNIVGSFRISFKVWIFKASFSVDMSWRFNSNDSALLAEVPILRLPQSSTGYLPVVATNILTNETFQVNYATTVHNSHVPYTDIPSPSSSGWKWNFGTEANQVTIPMDCFIDIELLKPVLPTSGLPLGGAANQLPAGYREQFPPQKGVGRQYTHQYKLDGIEILVWVPNGSSGSWQPYNIYEATTALVEANTGAGSINLSSLKQGYWQFNEPNKFNKIRLLAQNMFSYTSGTITTVNDLDAHNFRHKDVFCYDAVLREQVVNWKSSFTPEGTQYELGQVMYQGLKFTFSGEPGEVGLDTANANQRSLALRKLGRMEITFPEPVGSVTLKFGANNREVVIDYYKTNYLSDDEGMAFPVPELMDTAHLWGSVDQNKAVVYNDAAQPIDKIMLSVTHLNFGGYDSKLIIGGHFQLPSVISTDVDRDFELERSIFEVAWYKASVAVQEILPDNYLDSSARLGQWRLLPEDTGVGLLDGFPATVPGYYKLTAGGALEVQDVFLFSDLNHAFHVPENDALNLESGSFSFECTIGFSPYEAGVATLLSKVKEGDNPYQKYGFTLHLLQETPGQPDATYPNRGSVPSVKIVLTLFKKNFSVALPVPVKYNWDCVNSKLLPHQTKHILVSVDRASGYLYLFVDKILGYSYPISEVGVFPEGDSEDAITMLEEIRYLSLEAAQGLKDSGITEELHIEEVSVLGDGLTKTFQPIWRPDTHYAIQVKTSDTVGSTIYKKTFTFGFKTGGPIGYFHQNNKKYHDLLSKDRQDEFKLASLKYYIDYERSFPDAQSRFELSKPVFCLDPEFTLFFLKPYINAMYADWGGYKNLPVKESSLRLEVMEPSSPGTVLSPTFNWEEIEVEVTAEDLKFMNLLSPEPGGTCSSIPTIKRKIKIGRYAFPEPLEPKKLYTALFKAVYLENQGVEVHKYNFLTSRYASFEEQVTSYLTESGDYRISAISVGEFNQAYLDGVLQPLLNQDGGDDPVAVVRFSGRFDRLLFGGLRLGTLEVYDRTIISKVTGTVTGGVERILGILIQNPEPFNDPKMPERDLQGIGLLPGGGEGYLDGKRTVHMENDQNSPSGYQYIFSQDNSAVFITNEILSVPEGNITLTFRFKLFDGKEYVTKDTVVCDPISLVSP